MEENLKIKYKITLSILLITIIISIFLIIICFNVDLTENTKTLIIGICSGFITGLLPISISETFSYYTTKRFIIKKKSYVLYPLIDSLRQLYDIIKNNYSLHFNNRTSTELFSWESFIKYKNSKPINPNEKKALIENYENIKNKLNKLKSITQKILKNANFDIFNKKEFRQISLIEFYCKEILETQLNLEENLEKIFKLSSYNYYLKDYDKNPKFINITEP